MSTYFPFCRLTSSDTPREGISDFHSGVSPIHVPSLTRYLRLLLCPFCSGSLSSPSHRYAGRGIIEELSWSVPPPVPNDDWFMTIVSSTLSISKSVPPYPRWKKMA